MNIVATSDLHGHLPEIPECDLLLIAGDVCPATNHGGTFQRHWLRTVFDKWLASVPAKAIVGVWGNHDFIGQRDPHSVSTLRWKNVSDTLIELNGIRIAGCPWTRWFNNWAFNLHEADLDRKFRVLPPADIVVSHGPPLYYGDRIPSGECVGSDGFVKYIDAHKPKLAVYGHIHCDQGVWRRGDTLLANVAHVDDDYRPYYGPVSFTL